MGKYHKRAVAVFVALCLCACGAAQAAVQLEIVHAMQQEDEASLVLLATDSDTDALVPLAFDTQHIQVLADKVPLANPKSIQTFSNSNLGTAYLLILDLNSNALSATKGLSNMKDGMEEIVSNMRDNDQAMLMTINGSGTQTLGDFSSDKVALRTQIDEISTTGRRSKTRVLEGLYKAFRSFGVTSPDFPTRHVIVLFTFGADNSSYSVDEIAELAAQRMATLYVVGVKGRDSSPDLIDEGRIARASGGRLFDQSKYTPKEGATRIREYVQGSYVLEVPLSSDVMGKGNVAFTVVADSGSIAYQSSELSFFVAATATPLPTATPKAKPVAATVTATPTVAPTSTPTPAPTATPTPTLLSRLVTPPLIYIMGGALVLVAVLVVLLIISKRPTAPDILPDEPPEPSPDMPVKPDSMIPSEQDALNNRLSGEETISSGTMGKFDVPVVDLDATIPRGSSSILLQFSIESNGKSVAKTVPLISEIVIGRSDRASIVLEDRTVSRTHCKILLRANAMYVKDMGSMSGTLLNDKPVVDEAQLRSGDVLQLGDSKLTVTVKS